MGVRDEAGAGGDHVSLGMHLHGLQVVIFPGLTAGDTALQVLPAGSDVALEDSVQRDGVAAQANDLIAHLQEGRTAPARSPSLPTGLRPRVSAPQA